MASVGATGATPPPSGDHQTTEGDALTNDKVVTITRSGRTFQILVGDLKKLVKTQSSERSAELMTAVSKYNAAFKDTAIGNRVTMRVGLGADNASATKVTYISKDNEEKVKEGADAGENAITSLKAIIRIAEAAMGESDDVSIYEKSASPPSSPGTAPTSLRGHDETRDVTLGTREMSLQTYYSLPLLLRPPLSGAQRQAIDSKAMEHIESTFSTTIYQNTRYLGGARDRILRPATDPMEKSQQKKIKALMRQYTSLPAGTTKNRAEGDLMIKLQAAPLKISQANARGVINDLKDIKPSVVLPKDLHIKLFGPPGVARSLTANIKNAHQAKIKTLMAKVHIASLTSETNRKAAMEDLKTAISAPPFNITDAKDLKALDNGLRIASNPHDIPELCSRLTAPTAALFAALSPEDKLDVMASFPNFPAHLDNASNATLKEELKTIEASTTPTLHPTGQEDLRVRMRSATATGAPASLGYPSRGEPASSPGQLQGLLDSRSRPKHCRLTKEMLFKAVADLSQLSPRDATAALATYEFEPGKTIEDTLGENSPADADTNTNAGDQATDIKAFLELEIKMAHAQQASPEMMEKLKNPKVLQRLHDLKTAGHLDTAHLNQVAMDKIFGHGVIKADNLESAAKFLEQCEIEGDFGKPPLQAMGQSFMNMSIHSVSSNHKAGRLTSSQVSLLTNLQKAKVFSTFGTMFRKLVKEDGPLQSDEKKKVLQLLNRQDPEYKEARIKINSYILDCLKNKEDVDIDKIKGIINDSNIHASDKALIIPFIDRNQDGAHPDDFTHLNTKIRSTKIGPPKLSGNGIPDGTPLFALSPDQLSRLTPAQTAHLDSVMMDVFNTNIFLKGEPGLISDEQDVIKKEYDKNPEKFREGLSNFREGILTRIANYEDLNPADVKALIKSSFEGMEGIVDDLDLLVKALLSEGTLPSSISAIIKESLNSTANLNPYQKRQIVNELKRRLELLTTACGQDAADIDGKLAEIRVLKSELQAAQAAETTSPSVLLKREKSKLLSRISKKIPQLRTDTGRVAITKSARLANTRLKHLRAAEKAITVGLYSHDGSLSAKKEARYIKARDELRALANNPSSGLNATEKRDYLAFADDMDKLRTGGPSENAWRTDSHDARNTLESRTRGIEDKLRNMPVSVGAGAIDLIGGLVLGDLDSGGLALNPVNAVRRKNQAKVLKAARRAIQDGIIGDDNKIDRKKQAAFGKAIDKLEDLVITLQIDQKDSSAAVAEEIRSLARSMKSYVSEGKYINAEITTSGDIHYIANKLASLDTQERALLAQKATLESSAPNMDEFDRIAEFYLHDLRAANVTPQQLATELARRIGIPKDEVFHALDDILADGPPPAERNLTDANKAQIFTTMKDGMIKSTIQFYEKGGMDEEALKEIFDRPEVSAGFDPIFADFKSGKISYEELKKSIDGVIKKAAQDFRFSYDNSGGTQHASAEAFHKEVATLLTEIEEMPFADEVGVGEGFDVGGQPVVGSPPTGDVGASALASTSREIQSKLKTIERTLLIKILAPMGIDISDSNAAKAIMAALDTRDNTIDLDKLEENGRSDLIPLFNDLSPEEKSKIALRAGRLGSVHAAMTELDSARSEGSHDRLRDLHDQVSGMETREAVATVQDTHELHQKTAAISTLTAQLESFQRRTDRPTMEEVREMLAKAMTNADRGNREIDSLRENLKSMEARAVDFPDEIEHRKEQLRELAEIHREGLVPMKTYYAEQIASVEAEVTERFGHIQRYTGLAQQKLDDAEAITVTNRVSALQKETLLREGQECIDKVEALKLENSGVRAQIKDLYEAQYDGITRFAEQFDIPIHHKDTFLRAPDESFEMFYSKVERKLALVKSSVSRVSQYQEAFLAKIRSLGPQIESKEAELTRAHEAMEGIEADLSTREREGAEHDKE